MYRRTAGAILFALCATHAGALHAERDPVKADDIKTLLRLMRSTDVGLQFAETKVDYVLVYARKAKPQLPVTAFNEIKQEVIGEVEQKLWIPGGLGERLATIWDKAFTHEEIKQLIRFYQSPLGKKLVAATPLLTRETRAIGKHWGKAIEPLIADRVRAKLALLE